MKTLHTRLSDDYRRYPKSKNDQYPLDSEISFENHLLGYFDTKIRYKSILLFHSNYDDLRELSESNIWMLPSEFEVSKVLLWYYERDHGVCDIEKT